MKLKFIVILSMLYLAIADDFPTESLVVRLNEEIFFKYNIGKSDQ